MVQQKLRLIVKSKNLNVYGFTVPKEIALFYSGCCFNVSVVNNSIIFTSGTSIIPTQEQINNYRFDD